MVDLPDPETPVTTEHAERYFQIDAAQVVNARPGQLLAGGFAAVRLGQGYWVRPERYLPVMEFGFSTSATVPRPTVCRRARLHQDQGRSDGLRPG